MRILRLFAIVAALCAFRAAAQVTIEPEIVTDSIDLFAVKKASSGSNILMPFASLIIPGLGYQITGKSEKAIPYFCADALFWFGAIMLSRQSQKIYGNSRAFAWQYADAPANGTDKDSYWKNLALYMDSDEYNRVQEYNRTPENKLTGQNESWRWINEDLMKEYVDMRETAARYRVAWSFSVAAIVFNRAVSFIEMRRNMRNNDVSQHTSIHFSPVYSSVNGAQGIQITTDW
jgi:hypothetical protein